MKTFYKISLGLLVLTCNIFSCKNDVVPLPRSMKLASPSPSVYGGVTTVMTGLYNLGPMAVDAAHNFYFIPYNTGQLFDTTGIYKVTPAGVKTLLAGGPFHPPLDGTGANARFWYLDGLTLGPDSALYVTEAHFGNVRKITLKGVVTSVGPYPFSDDAQGLKLGTDGNLYVAFGPPYSIITVIKPDGTSYTLAGGIPGYQDGPAGLAMFLYPRDVAICHDSTVFVADGENNALRKIKGGIVSTFKTGIDGYSLLFDSSGNLYVGEASKITKITPDGVVSTLAGSDIKGSSDGVGSAATFSGPLYLAINRDVLYVADVGNSSIRKVMLK